MVKLIFKQVTVNFLFIVTCFYCNSQNLKTELDLFSSYSNWGYSIAPLVYKKASITRNFGNTILNNKSMPSIQLGVKYHILKHKRISFNSGLKFTLQPLMNTYFKLSKDDVYEGFNGFEESIKEYGYVFLSIPINIEYKRKINSKVVFNSNLGLDIFYLDRSRNILSVVLASEEINETREVFAAYQETQKNRLQASAVFSVVLETLLTD